MANQFRYIIVGGGPAGASAIEGIRLHDHSGSIALLTKENRPPYDRTALSKALWLGKKTIEEIPLFDVSYYRRMTVHVFLETEIARIDTKRRQVVDRSGTHYTYEKLLLATGGSPRTLSFGEDAIGYFRTVEDYFFLKEAADLHDEFLLLGGGFIGSELAAALTTGGKTVSLVFPEQYLLQKVFPEDLAAYVTEYYRTKGVRILHGDLPVEAARRGGKVHVTTKSGKRLKADIAVGAIGLNLHTEMAKRAGLSIDGGIVVNSFLQSSDPSIYAAGDITCFPAKWLDRNIRIEHWDNAQAQGRLAGENMAGGAKPYEYLPYFWSDLFDLGFEAVGELDSRLETFCDWHEQFREGVIYYLDHGRVKGVLLWNVWGKVGAARELVMKRKAFEHPQRLKGML